MNEATGRASVSLMFPWPTLLSELQSEIRQRSDPLAQARLAMTCRAEHAARVVWYDTHLAGPRTPDHWRECIMRHGTDADIVRELCHASRDCYDLDELLPFQGDGIGKARYKRMRLVQDALILGRDAAVLAWGAACPVAALQLRATAPYLVWDFNSHATGAAFLSWRSPPSDEEIAANLPFKLAMCWRVLARAATLADEVLDIFRTQLELLLGRFAWRMDRLDLLAQLRLDAATDDVRGLPVPSPAFLQALSARAKASLDIRDYSLAQYTAVVGESRQRAVPLFEIRNLDVIALVCAQQQIDVCDAWNTRVLTCNSAAHAVLCMERFTLPWSSMTLANALRERDVAAVVWQLQRPDRFRPMPGSDLIDIDPLRMRRDGCATLVRLLQLGWLPASLGTLLRAGETFIKPVAFCDPRRGESLEALTCRLGTRFLDPHSRERGLVTLRWTAGSYHPAYHI